MKRTFAYLLVFILLGLPACGDDAGPENVVDPTPPTSDAAVQDDASTTAPDTTPEPGDDTLTPDVIPEPPQGDHDTFETAAALDWQAGEATGALAPTGDVDFFVFEGVAGQAMEIVVTAQAEPFDANTIDVVLTLYDADQNPLALNDDPYPRVTNDSQILTILPADGSYYIRLEECWTWVATNNFNASCAEPQNKAITDYTLAINLLDAETPQTFPNEEGDAPTSVSYVAAEDEGYEGSLLFGTFSDAADVDVFAFTLPEDLVITEGARATVGVGFHNGGPTGIGSTSDVGGVTLAHADTPDTVVAYTDANATAFIRAPLEAGESYLLSVSHPGVEAGSNDFYFAYHFVGESLSVEGDDDGNGTVEGAEALVGELTDDGTAIGYGVEGNLTDASTDEDHYLLAIPETVVQPVKLAVSCSAQRDGSGLRKFAMAVVNAEGQYLSGLKTEQPGVAVELTALPIPADASSVVLKLSAASQADDVTSDYYRCTASMFTEVVE